MSKIETGCLALVINCKDAGKVCTVGEFIGHMNGVVESKLWEVDIEITLYRLNIVTREVMEKKVNYIPEAYLLRIDGDNLLSEKEKEEQLLLS